MTAAVPATTALGPRNSGDVDATWADLGERALTAYHAGKYALCREACREAGALLVQLPPNDPRRAATLNNLGMAAWLAGSTSDAEQNFAAAGAAWRAAKAWVAAMAVASPARSSLHHLRLEARHRSSYDPLLRGRQLRLLAGGRAASLFNRALCVAGSDPSRSASMTTVMDRAATQRLRALGPHNPEAARMRALQGDLALARGDAAATAAYRAQTRQIADSPARNASALWEELRHAERNDLWRLRAAVCLTLVAKGGTVSAVP